MSDQKKKAQQSWWRNRTVLISGGIILALVIAGGVTAGVLLGKGNPKSTVPVSTTTTGTSVPVGINVGDRAPNFTLQSLDGKTVSLDQFRGHIVILDFWASWCTPCRMSMPTLHKYYEDFKSRGVVMLGVSLDHTAAAARDYLASNGYTDLIALWGSQSDVQAVAQEYGVYGIPHTFVIDKQGIIRFSEEGIKDLSHPVGFTEAFLASLVK